MKHFLLLCALFCLGCGENRVRSDEKKLALEWELRSNHLDDEERWLSVFRLINQADKPVKGSWELFFSHSPGRMIDTIAASGYGFKVKHWAGDLFSISPSDQGATLYSGDTLTIPLESSGAILKDSDAPRGMYMIFDGNDQELYFPELRKLPVSEEAGLYRGSDKVIPENSFDRYQAYSALDQMAGNELCPITPEPFRWRIEEEVLMLQEGIAIVTHEELRNEADKLKKFLEQEGVRSVIEGEKKNPGSGDISLQLDADLEKEGYKLVVQQDGIAITGGSPAAVYYAVNSLKRLLHKSDSGVGFNKAEIYDRPQHGYRGMHLDVARNFSEVETVLRLLDLMGYYKLNTFHFHLTDDEGWRVEIPGLEELTSLGGRRHHTRDESEGLFHQYGSARTQSGNGYYTRDEYMKILEYAAERHIEVIPEIDLPGHARAAVVAMKARAKRLKAAGRQDEAEQFQLHDPEDRSSYLSVQNFSDNVVNVCQPSLYAFVEKVVAELQEMHLKAGNPMRTLHIGGDEVPDGVWEKSAACMALFPEEEGLGSKAKQYFIEQVNDILTGRNIKMAGWEEIGLEKAGEEKLVNRNLAKQNAPLLYHWHNASRSGADLSEQFAEAGYPVVLSHVTHLYFDMAYSNRPEDPGFYWGGFVDTRKVFEFDYPVMTKGIAGIQGQLWSEVIHSDKELEYAVFPKLIALAERAWRGNLVEKDLNRAWNNFANRLVHFELPWLNRKGVRYRIPQPGGFVKNDTLYLNSAFPGLEIRYAVDGLPGPESPLYTRPVKVNGEIKAVLCNDQGRSGYPATIVEWPDNSEL